MAYKLTDLTVIIHWGPANGILYRPILYALVWNRFTPVTSSVAWNLAFTGFLSLLSVQVDSCGASSMAGQSGNPGSSGGSWPHTATRCLQTGTPNAGSRLKCSSCLTRAPIQRSKTCLGHSKSLTCFCSMEWDMQL